MRILQLCNKFVYPAKDGGAIAVINLTKSFSLQGCDVTVLAMNTSKHKFDLKNLPEEIKKLADWIAIDVDNEIKKFPALWNLLQNRSYNIQRFISSQYNDKLIELLHQKEFDIIQLEGLYLSPYVESIRAFSETKIVMRSHNIEHEIWERIAENEKSFLKKWYLKILARQLKKYEIERLNKYDMITSVTERDAEKLKSFGCELPMHICPAPYDETVLKPDKTKMEFPSVFFIGALDWLPNVEGLKWFLENVWEKVYHQFPDLKFYIAGRNAKKFSVDAKKNIVMVGEVENAYNFMNSKGIMIVPLLSGSGIRVKIIEGMALGKTIISTSLGAEGIPCKDGQNILIADTPETFAEKISKCINETMFFSIIGDNAQQFARQRFSSHEVTNKLLEFFKQNLA
ncbi:MAG: glycosyltransferase family 4 protein [Bacteroidetes bacterium]|nr:glycosyltransferase family 4 protein [Bacteroidota bacterium]